MHENFIKIVSLTGIHALYICFRIVKICMSYNILYLLLDGFKQKRF